MIGGQINQKLKKKLSTLLVILWMILIFYLSHQPATGSNKLSTEITEVIVKAIDKIIPNLDFDLGTFNYLIRKGSYFFAYLILGVLVSNGLRSSAVYGYKNIAMILVICVIYAISGEGH